MLIQEKRTHGGQRLVESHANSHKKSPPQIKLMRAANVAHTLDSQESIKVA